MSEYEFKEISDGFIWGPVRIRRTRADSVSGITMEVTTPSGNRHNRLRIRITPKGWKVIVIPIDGLIEVLGFRFLGSAQLDEDYR